MIPGLNLPVVREPHDNSGSVLWMEPVMLCLNMGGKSEAHSCTIVIGGIGTYGYDGCVLPALGATERCRWQMSTVVHRPKKGGVIVGFQNSRGSDRDRD